MKTLLFIRDNEYFLLCNKFINLLMYDGKKSKASKIFFSMLQSLKHKIDRELDKKTTTEDIVSQQNFLINYVVKAIENVKPTVEVKKVRVAGSTYLVPAILSKKKQQTLAIRWLIEAARKRKKNTSLVFSQCLTEEIFEAVKKQGNARQKRDEMHRLAEANRAYVRYRWW
jgi:small subunit ribosomal protein S7